MLDRLFGALMLPDTRAQYEQNQQPQVVFAYDPQQYYSRQEELEDEEDEGPWVEWDTFVLYGQSNSLLWRIRHGQQYIEELEEVYRQMMSELRNVKIMGGMNRLIEEHNELRAKYNKMATELAVLKAEKEYQEEQTKAALEMSSKTEKINRVMEENGFEKKAKEEQPREGTQFASKDGRGKPEKQRIAVAMRACGFANDAISAATGIGANSVGTYISGMKGKYQIWRDDDGSLGVTFNDDLGVESWNLSEKYGAARTHTEGAQEDMSSGQEEDPVSRIVHSSAGKIVKGLRTPVIAG